ncbi:TetR/AcrR family transcriptional regulator [Aurantimonas endophytica]|uniref:AcrR family transcriptional regulator n=1 Tax=Aurantimonas endophytica TaxID=1522175 RepID=A0A7W6MRL2_9HYPH|nr:TetR/AcrR family transcriptional regulator [Aurantimonas endophytica]MBB4005165.1 AcrR family transcriptional regulator [Aurantimonas endophytica]MCO6406172.1 TetR family transcriptional regulator [Aurantimonas endophytica]
MNKRNDMIAGADLAFDAEGFRGIGVDGILAPSGASTRTLYKHFGSRDGLVLAVLEERHRAFMARLEAGGETADPIGALFDALEQWLVERGARGCMLLRARSEYAGANADVVALVRRQKHEFEAEIAARVKQVLGRADADLTVQVWLLFEGATAAASVADLSVVGAAKRAAANLLAAAGSRER